MLKKKSNNMNRTEFFGIVHPGYIKKILETSCIFTALLIVLPLTGSAATPTYTGCVNITGIGDMPRMLYNFAQGTSPSSPCKSGDIRANFSAGTQTVDILEM